MLLSIRNMLCHRKIKHNNHHRISFLGKEMCSRWRSRSVATAELEFTDRDLQSGLSVLHYLHWGGKGLWMPPSPLTCFFRKTDELQPKQHLFTAAYCEYPLKRIQLPLSQRTQSSSIFLIYPPDSLPIQQVYTICRCGKGGRKSLPIYNQSSSPALFLKPCLRPFLQSLIYAVPSILLNL